MSHKSKQSVNHNSELWVEPDLRSVSRLVIASFKNGSVLPDERMAILQAAQAAAITTWDYLRGRLLLQAGIPLEDPHDSK